MIHKRGRYFSIAVDFASEYCIDSFLKITVVFCFLTYGWSRDPFFSQWYMRLSLYQNVFPKANMYSFKSFNIVILEFKPDTHTPRHTTFIIEQINIAKSSMINNLHKCVSVCGHNSVCVCVWYVILFAWDKTIVSTCDP